MFLAGLCRVEVGAETSYGSGLTLRPGAAARNGTEVGLEILLVHSMISTVQQMMSVSLVVGLSRWLRTDLILAATLLFLLCASWAMLVSAQSSLHRRQVGPPSDRDAPADSADSAQEGPRRGGILGTFGIVLGLLSSLALFAICAW
jgi:hypothetical protein